MYTSRILASSTRIARVAHSRALHSTPSALKSQATKGQPPTGARQPKENTLLDQNPHLKHATSSKGGKEGRDSGKGNAAEEPTLPSHQMNNKREGKSSSGASGNGKRTMHTSAVVRAEGDEKHSADSYFKDVDSSPPLSTKTHLVDGGSEATHRPNEQHSDPKKEYATVSKDEPYEPPSEESDGEKPEQKEQNLRYGGTPRDAERDAPKRNEGPDAKDAGGRKP